jgi:hypothetical protein
MIAINFNPFSLSDPGRIEWWTKWTLRAERETAAVVTSFETWLQGAQNTGEPFRFNFKTEVWKELKDWYLENVFYQKCAYCEREISGYYGDAEHYRPKGAVKQATSGGGFQRVTCELPDPSHPEQRITAVHPGYFWLAYDWRNLLPACVYCNSGYGKNDQFEATRYVVMVELGEAQIEALPIHERPRRSIKWPTYYYPTPSGLDLVEEPQLLNPLNAMATSDPRKHIRFGIKGMVAPVDASSRGQSSIGILQLRDERLRQARQNAQETFRDKYYDAMRRFDPTILENSEARLLLNRYSEGRYPFSAAALDYHQILTRMQP